MYTGATIIGQSNVTFGPTVGALPNGRAHPKPLGDCMSPFPGMDRNGVIGINRHLYNAGGECAEVCNSEARILLGKAMTAEALVSLGPETYEP